MSRMSGKLLLASAGLVCGLVSYSLAQEGFRSTQPRNDRRGPGGQNISTQVPSLSESTAILESAVRNLYKEIEPGKETMPNELIAYADLRALRLYTGALEVAGWDLENASQTYNDLQSGRTSGRSRYYQEELQAARDRYLAFRETVRTLLYRVRTTAVAVEHQVSFCDIQVARAWQREVVPALMDTISSTTPLFYEESSYTAYNVPGENVVVTTSNAGIPNNAVDVSKNNVYQPYEGKGRGEGRYFEIRAFGGPVRVKSIRYRSHESSFGVIGTSVVRQMNVDQIATPSQPLFIPCNRERFVDLSELEVEWESADGRRKTFGSIEVVADGPRGDN